MNTHPRPSLDRLFLIIMSIAFLPAIAFLLAPLESSAQIPEHEYSERRSTLMEQLPDGLIILKARASAKSMEAWGWIQNASFYYFTGLASQPAAILVLDAPRNETILFVPPDPLSFGRPVRGLSVVPGKRSADSLGISEVRAWDAFPAFIEDRMSTGIETIYIERSRRKENLSVPGSMMAVSGEFTLWEQSLSQTFPGLAVESASGVIGELRWKKSEAEVEILRTNATNTVSALKKGAEILRPGLMQREAEAAVVAGCILAGAEGPSFWPWMMSGPNTNFAGLNGSFFDYHSLNREMKGGELVRADVGCASGYYGGDVGRTFPVLGKFTAEQRVVWDLLVTGYKAGIDAMADGVRGDSVRARSREAIKAAGKVEAEREGSHRATLDISAAMTSEDGGVDWHIHGVGVDSGEEQQPVLVEGAVVAYEPGFTWNNESYYLEDMILIHASRGEVLSRGLPYFADEIESFLALRRHASGDVQPLFNGRDLSGWINYGTEKWYVENGELVCESGPDAGYGYLGTEEVFADFDLTLEFLQESNGNSGIFFRSWVEGTTVEGWQVEVAPSGSHTGGIYESYGRGWLIQPDQEGEKALREGQWNTMRILAIGGHVTTWLNGQRMVNITDDVIAKATGRIALQIHDGGGIKVRWRNISIRHL